MKNTTIEIMVEKKVVNQINAAEARSNAEIAHADNFERALTQIRSESKIGHTETVIYGYPIGFNEAQKLIELGYTVTRVVNPMDLIKMYKIGW